MTPVTHIAPTPRTSDYRKHIPLGVKLHAALLLLGFTDEEITQGGIEWDHWPALGLREIVDGRMVPDPNDPHHIRPLRAKDHDTKTNGKGGEKRVTTLGSDKHAISKANRFDERRAGITKPKREIRSRGFPKDTPKKRWPKRPMNTKRMER